MVCRTICSLAAARAKAAVISAVTGLVGLFIGGQSHRRFPASQEKRKRILGAYLPPKSKRIAGRAVYAQLRPLETWAAARLLGVILSILPQPTPRSVLKAFTRNCGPCLTRPPPTCAENKRPASIAGSGPDAWVFPLLLFPPSGQAAI